MKMAPLLGEESRVPRAVQDISGAISCERAIVETSRFSGVGQRAVGLILLESVLSRICVLA